MTDEDGAPAPTIRVDDCCRPARDPRIASHFDSLTLERTAGGVIPPMQPVSMRLFEELKPDAEATLPSVLELGCGSGGLAVALLESGAAEVDGIDLSSESLATARRRAAEAGVLERMTFTLADGAFVEVTPHDWVVMDRVICCYPDVDALLANAMRGASSRVAFTVPTSRGWRGFGNRLVWGAESLLTRIWRGPCPGYVHSLDLIGQRLRDGGFSLVRERPIGMWYAAIWERAEVRP